MAYADDLTVFVYEQNLTVLFQRLFFAKEHNSKYREANAKYISRV